ncbi:Hypothetical predicted protein [Pelobates cultripes]|nr:Hypothetical predicted protein [Pelobates cultripes]
MGTLWILSLLAASVAANLCPDGTRCGEDSLCCELSGEQGYGCCSKEEIVSRSLPMISTENECSARESCPAEYSCVNTPQGNSACCPLPQGSSCQDGSHCCPSGTLCSSDGHHCIPATNQSAVICPDGKSECPSDATCCVMADQSWGCCPMPQASCCSDHLHCCPRNTLCDVQHSRCQSEDGVTPWMRKLPARVKLVGLGDIFKRTNCSDHTTCPNGATCCLQKDGKYGCCPFTDGVCCRDHVHCCPSGTRCDLTHNKCASLSLETPLFTKTPALEEADVKCDDSTSCPGDSTCCRLESGEWGCCPIPQAVCCDDHVHCCPGGYTCSGSQCVNDGVSIPLLRKTPALKHKENNVQCNDTAFCPDGATCCRLKSGAWGCCPLEHAVCCDDHEHCCPSGHTCSGGQCLEGENSIPAFKKLPALTNVASNANRVPCDASTSCPDGSTCCRKSDGDWGCCPIEKAVCCSDHQHCCPEGYTCDVSLGVCNKANQRSEPNVPSVSTTPIQPVDYVWCDSSHACYDGQTCCVGPGGVWQCCPYTQGVCCPDRVHCCPYGHICLNAGAACSRAGPLSWLESPVPSAPIQQAKQINPTTPIQQAKPANPTTPIQPVDYVWCDSSHACYDGQTCCVGPGGVWQCCPYAHGVCCPDRVHCCPYGHVCLNSGAACSRAGPLSWLGPPVPSAPIQETKTSNPTTPIQPVDYVWCDSSHACYDGQTCCVGPGGVWQCCPYAHGVCCPDRVHCCPYGHVCLNSGSSCSRVGPLRWDGENRPENEPQKAISFL